MDSYTDMNVYSFSGPESQYDFLSRFMQFSTLNIEESNVPFTFNSYKT
jgi:hypothetical protein